MNRARSRQAARKLRHRRIRRRIRGTAACPRLAICISNRHIHAQLIDDDAAKTLAAASTCGTDVKVNVETAKGIGRKLGEAGQAAGVCRVVVDRGGLKFHGRVRSLVEAAVEGGLQVRKDPAADAELKEAS